MSRILTVLDELKSSCGAKAEKTFVSIFLRSGSRSLLTAPLSSVKPHAACLQVKLGPTTFLLPEASISTIEIQHT